MPNSWGYQTARAGTAVVTDASGTVIPANPARLYLYITNTGGSAAYFTFGAGSAAAINAGVRINGLGTPPASYEMCRSRGNVHTGPVIGLLTVPGTALFAYIEGS